MRLLFSVTNSLDKYCRDKFSGVLFTTWVAGGAFIKIHPHHSVKRRISFVSQMGFDSICRGEEAPLKEMWPGWKRPAWGGIFLLLFGFIAWYSFTNALRGPGWLAPFLIIIAPLFLSGILLLSAAGIDRNAV